MGMLIQAPLIFIYHTWEIQVKHQNILGESSLVAEKHFNNKASDHSKQMIGNTLTSM